MTVRPVCSQEALHHFDDGSLQIKVREIIGLVIVVGIYLVARGYVRLSAVRILAS
jgi:hypothetical protein